MNTIKIKKLRKNARLPEQATVDSAGYDLFACIDAPMLLKAGGRVIIPTGIAIEMVLDYKAAAFVFGRSGLGIWHGVSPANAVGVIDADYRGEITVGLNNHSERDYTIQPGERIAQLLILPILTPLIEEAAELCATVRGSSGLGSTGR